MCENVKKGIMMEDSDTQKRGKDLSSTLLIGENFSSWICKTVERQSRKSGEESLTRIKPGKSANQTKNSGCSNPDAELYKPSPGTEDYREGEGDHQEAYKGVNLHIQIY